MADWPYIVKNNADIELLWLKVCQAVLKKFLPGGFARRGYIPDPNINAKCLEDCVVANHNAIKHEFILHCELLHYLKRDDTRHYATL